MKFFRFFTAVLPALFWLAIIFGFDKPYIAILTLIAAAIHEAGHIAAISLLKKESLSLPRAITAGFRIKVRNLSYKEEAVIALAGPFINLAVGFLTLMIFSASEYMTAFALINLLTGFSNLLIIEGFDGYKAVNAILSEILPIYKSDDITKKISFALSLILTFFSLYLLLRFGEGYWVFAVFFCIAIKFILKRR